MVKKPVLLIMALALLYSSLYAVPLNGNLVPVDLPDGSSVSVKMYGSEYYVRMESPEGYTLVNGKDGWLYYAILSADSTELLPDTIRYIERKSSFSQAQDIIPSGKQKQLKLNEKGLNKKIKEGKEKLTVKKKINVQFASSSGVSLSSGDGSISEPKKSSRTCIGQVRGLTMLVDFPAVPATIEFDQINNLLNQRGYTGYGNNGSVRDYFYDVSGGKLDYTNEVTAYYRTKYEKKYYADNGGDLLVLEALQNLIDNGYDFSNLTLDEDGNIRALNLMYAGEPIYNTGLHPHASFFEHIKVTGEIYAQSYELSDISSKPHIGTFVHENGHSLLFWGDLYGDRGVGMYCLMGSGSKCDDGRNPMVPNPYNCYRAGWLTIIDITNAASGTRYYHDANSLTAYRYSNSSKPSEYFLIESRIKAGRNSEIVDSGLIIWHIEEIYFGYDVDPYYALVTVEQADGLNHLEQAINWGMDGDLFHDGYKNEFNDLTVPSANWWNGSNSALSINAISAISPRMSFSVNTGVSFNLSISPNPVKDLATVEFIIKDGSLSGKAASLDLYRDDVFIGKYGIVLTSGIFSKQVKIESYPEGIYQLRLNVNNIIVDKVNFKLIPPTPIIELSTGKKRFKNVLIGNTYHGDGFIKNIGDKDLIIHSVSVDNPAFAIQIDQPVTIAPYDYAILDWYFMPDYSGTEQKGIITILSNAVNTPIAKIELSGNGIFNYNLAVTPNPLNTSAKITFNIQNPALNNTVAEFSLSRVLEDNSIVPVEQFTSNITTGLNSISRPSWDTLSGGNYRVVMRLGTVSAAECVFVKNQIYNYNLSVSPTIFSSGAKLSFSMQNPAYVSKQAQFSLYQIFRSGAPNVLVNQFTSIISAGTNTIVKTDWDYLPQGYYTVEMAVDGIILDRYSIEKLPNPNVFQLSVSPSTAIEKATVTYNVADANLIGKAAVIACKQNETVQFTRTQSMVSGLNTLNITFNDYTPLASGQYKMLFSVNSFVVDSTVFTKEDKKTTVSVSATSVSFGQVITSSSKTASITLTNTGNSKALISGLNLRKSEFTQNGVTPITLVPGASKVITLTFTPVSNGVVLDTLIIINAPDVNIQTIKVPLSGQGITQTTTTFQVTMTRDGSVVDNAIGPQLTIKNIGSQSIDVSDLIVEFYTYDPLVTISNLRADIYYCTLNGATATFSRLPAGVGSTNQKADVVTKFTFPSGRLDTKQVLPLNFGIHTADWRYNFTEADDWSYVVGTGNIAPNIVIRSISTGIILYGSEPVIK